MIVLDTHAWIWWVSSPALLSETAKSIIDGAVTEHFYFCDQHLGGCRSCLAGQVETDDECRRLGCRLRGPSIP